MNPPAPSRVLDFETFWQRLPPELSPRCQWWVERISAGWRPNKRIRTMGYYSSAWYFGVYIAEYLQVLSPLLNGGRCDVERRPPVTQQEIDDHRGLVRF